MSGTYWYNNRLHEIADYNDKNRIQQLERKRAATIGRSNKKKITDQINGIKEEVTIKHFKYQSSGDFFDLIKRTKDMEDKNFKEHSYFQKFREITQALHEDKDKKNEYLHLDIFNYRVTSSSTLLDLIKKHPWFFYYFSKIPLFVDL